MLILRIVAWLLPVSMVVLGTGAVFAQDYPNKPIRIVTGTAGGGTDLVARTISQGISGPLGQPVIIDNRAGGAFGDVVPKTPPDGYTLFVGGSNVWTLSLFQKTSYDAESDFSPISLLVREVNVLVGHPSLPVKSIKELIALAKARPGELNYASSAIGGSTHIMGELFKSMAGVNIVHVPYKGSVPALTALISGEVQLTFAGAIGVAPHLKSGRMRGLAVTSADPSALAPGLPPLAASGLPGYEMTGATGMFAPAKTSDAIINRLNREAVRVLNLPDVKERILNAGVEVVSSSPEQFRAKIKSDIVTTSKVIKSAGIKTE